jgi:hypothetical protein
VSPLVICLFSEKGIGQMKPQNCSGICVMWHSGKCLCPEWILTKNGSKVNVKAAPSPLQNCMTQVELRCVVVVILSWFLITFFFFNSFRCLAQQVTGQPRNLCSVTDKTGDPCLLHSVQTSF